MVDYVHAWDSSPMRDGSRGLVHRADAAFDARLGPWTQLEESPALGRGRGEDRHPGQSRAQPVEARRESLPIGLDVGPNRAQDVVGSADQRDEVWLELMGRADLAFEDVFAGGSVSSEVVVADRRVPRSQG